MSTKTKMMIGLGALGTLLAIPFAVSSCQTTGTHNEDTMMNVGAMRGDSAHSCSCAKEGKACECQKGECRGSCGGEDSVAACDDTACGGE